MGGKTKKLIFFMLVCAFYDSPESLPCDKTPLLRRKTPKRRAIGSHAGQFQYPCTILHCMILEKEN